MDNERHRAQLRDKAAEFALYVQFMQSFEAYRVLSVDDKLIITKAFISVFMTLEQFYITYENGGHRTGRIHSYDYTYFAVMASHSAKAEELSVDELPPVHRSTPRTFAENGHDEEEGFGASKNGPEK